MAPGDQPLIEIPHAKMRALPGIDENAGEIFLSGDHYGRGDNVFY
jgi:hypothetical protein